MTRVPSLTGSGSRFLRKDADFDAACRHHGLGPLTRACVETLQINVGKLCNQACHHCHVDAGPKRSERMRRETASRLVALARNSPGLTTVDLTGGAPELNPSFAFLVEEMRALGLHVIVRCNLTVLFEPGMEWLPRFYRANQVELICSLPCYTAENVDKQRGSGVFARSIEALQTLNALGFGVPASPLGLALVYNPLGAFLPPPQAELETSYRTELRRLFGIEFSRLFTITNMPIKRFAEQLARNDETERYMSLLVNHFNPATVEGLMCRTMVSVGWQGRLYDCDFHQMMEIPLGGAHSVAADIDHVESLDELRDSRIATAPHCFGCTAGAGSSCGGALAS